MRAVILFMMFSINLVVAQSYQFDWTRQGGGAEDDELYGLTTTSDGHYVIAGNFTGVFSLGDTVLNSAGEADIYVAKYTREAELVWAKRFGNELYDMALSVESDKNGNIYAAGFVVSENNKNDLDSDAWVIALSADGEELWTEQITTAQGDLIIDITVDADDVLYMTGEYAGAGEVGGYRLEEFGETDMFLAAYSLADRRFEWVEAAGGSGFDSGISVETTPDRNLIWAGYFYEDSDMFGQQLTGEGFEDIFVINLNNDASVNWMVTAGGEAEDVANSIAVDQSGNVLVAGSFEGFAEFDGVAVNGSGGSDIYLAKYNSHGSIQWVRQAGGSEDDEAHAVALDEYGNSYLTGAFQESAWFDNTELVSAGEDDLFFARYDANGSLGSVDSEGGEQVDEGTQIAIDAHGATVLAGVFESEADFGDTTLVSGGALDIFVSRLSASDITGLGSGIETVQDFELHENYPNPFNPSTTIRFSLLRPAQVRLAVYNILGEEVKELVNDNLGPGSFNQKWLGKNNAGSSVVSGMYIYQLEVEGNMVAKKMLLLK